MAAIKLDEDIAEEVLNRIADNWWKIYGNMMTVLPLLEKKEMARDAQVEALYLLGKAVEPLRPVFESASDAEMKQTLNEIWAHMATYEKLYFQKNRA